MSMILKNLTLAQIFLAVPGKPNLSCCGDTDFGNDGIPPNVETHTFSGRGADQRDQMAAQQLGEMMRLPARFIVIIFCGLLAGSPVIAQTAQTVELSTRTFWLGEVPNTMSVDPPFFDPGRIRWISKIMDADPVLKDTVIHVELALMPAGESVREEPDNYVPLGKDRLNPRYDVPGYRIFGYPAPLDNPTRPSNRLRYMPLFPGADFFVSCGVNNVREEIVLCVVYATYPPDDGIRLKARLYFPKDPATRPGYFREVAERMRDLLYCLDVTDHMVDVKKERPTLTGCRPDVNS